MSVVATRWSRASLGTASAHSIIGHGVFQEGKVNLFQRVTRISQGERAILERKRGGLGGKRRRRFLRRERSKRWTRTDNSTSRAARAR